MNESKQMPRRKEVYEPRPNQLAEQCRQQTEARYGKIVEPSTETFTLQSGEVIPIYRREWPQGNRPRPTGREGDRVE